MRVKRYIVDSMPDALQQIRTDLGKDAVILNTKEIRSGGFLGLFSKKKIEVIAATDTSSAPASANTARTRPTAAPPISPQSGTTAAQAAVAVLEQRIANQQTEGSTSLQHAEAQSTVAARQLSSAPIETSTPTPIVTAQHGAAQYSAVTGVPKTAAAPPVKAAIAAEPNTDYEVLNELRAMKQMMLKLSANGTVSEPNPVLASIEERLLEQEILPSLAQQLVSEVEEAALHSGEELTIENAKQAVKDKLRIILGANTHKPLSSDTRIAHFVGPTGVGKTTTIAKLAAEQVLKYRRKVGFITSDTYRIAAVDQLKTYATILGIPLEVVFSPMDLKKAFDALHECDVIFMDTAGRNFRNEMYVSELNALLQSGGKSETFLVLSLTTKYKDMRAIADNFSKFKLEKVLFTKRDETDTFGPIVNLLHEFPLQLSYITTGQNVPDDFTVANENEIIELIMEEQPDE